METAPIVVFAGSYFPAWIPSVMLGMVLAGLVYALLVWADVARSIPLPGVFYLLLSALAAMGLWQLLFARATI
ncbi:YtcA family lipoprotein [uncultured Thiodictyon sp.]|jgi:hypothetical protein|uniref:YtcA family lipoprotein n=1 Tax=uncultured Thiodictyon sp. TaxID=1846217 RepID=UPI0025F9F42C|nr:YtcA family lipoprotein [uncultured Thiodictyon sp.]